MGWRTVADVRDYSRASGSAYVVLVMLAERAPDETRRAHPGLTLLACDSRVDRSTVQRALKKLEELGEIEAAAYREGGRGKATEWLVHAGPELYEETYAEVKGLQDATPRNGGTSHANGGTSHAKGRSLPPRLKGTGVEPDSSTEAPSAEALIPSPADELFEFWRSTFGLNGATRFTPARRRKVGARLKENRTVEEGKRAILGCKGSKWHVDNGHTDLTQIFHAEKFDRFLSLPLPQGAAAGIEPTRRVNDGVPEISHDGGETWEADYEEAIRRRNATR